MPTQELTTLRLQWDLTALAGIEQDLRDGNSRISTIEDQIADLTLSLGVARDWRVDILSRRDTVREHLAAMQRAISPISACPDDILRAIFTHRAQQLDDKFGTSWFNKARAEAPFVIAAVCQSWSRVALATPTIWYYVAIPRLDSLPARPQCFIDRTRNVVARSCATPLDILFADLHDVELAAYTEILDIVYPHIDRWRRFEFWSSTQFPRIITYLRGRTSRLEGLSISYGMEDAHGAVEWSNVGDPSDFLVGAIRLSELCIKARWLNLDAVSLPRLQSLTLVVPSRMPSGRIWTFVASARQLTDLTLDLNDWDIKAGAIPRAVELPMLNQISLHNCATSILVHHPTAFSSPTLTKLRLVRVPVDPAVCLTQVLRSVSSNSALLRRLQTLKISLTSITSSDGQHIAHMANLTKLAIIRCAKVDAEFWAALETAPAALTHITLEAVDLTTGSIDAFLCLVRRRKSSQTCSRITEVVFHNHRNNFSNRDRGELNALLDPNA